MPNHPSFSLKSSGVDLRSGTGCQVLPIASTAFDLYARIRSSDSEFGLPGSEDYLTLSTLCKEEFSWSIGDVMFSDCFITNGSQREFSEAISSGKIAVLATDVHPDNGRYVEIPVEFDGLPNMIEAGVILSDPDVKVLSLSHVNRTTGVICPLADLKRISAKRQVLHVDVSHSHGVMPVDCTGADYITLDCNGINGPSGVGICWSSTHTLPFPEHLASIEFLAALKEALLISWKGLGGASSLAELADVVANNVYAHRNCEVLCSSVKSRSKRHVCFSIPEGSADRLSQMKTSFGINFDHPIPEDSMKTLSAMGIEDFDKYVVVVVDRLTVRANVRHFVNAFNSSMPL